MADELLGRASSLGPRAPDMDVLGPAVAWPVAPAPPARRDAPRASGPAEHRTACGEPPRGPNVGTWNDLGYKQWCKYDNVDPRDFYRLLRANASRSCGASKSQIVSDPRYHPKGAALAFYTAHHFVDPDRSSKIIAELLQRHQEGTLPKPILYNGLFFSDGKAMREARPGVRCII
ncbi:unnamed protein product [Prorocentrum cordatum]|uniref:Uncharacterized protein n=1 Tax=Prorocentrum cordatum TaxID=2364126 RepID=A0ABN9VRW2_9DINO|nr:unnamed protein product [Polarella glacialis]